MVKPSYHIIERHRICLQCEHGSENARFCEKWAGEVSFEKHRTKPDAKCPLGKWKDIDAKSLSKLDPAVEKKLVEIKTICKNCDVEFCQWRNRKTCDKRRILSAKKPQMIFTGCKMNKWGMDMLRDGTSLKLKSVHRAVAKQF